MRPQRGWLVAASVMCACVAAGADDASSTGVGTADASTTAGSTGDPAYLACDDPQVAVKAIFDAQCTNAGCHGMTASADLNLSVDDWPAQLVGQPSSQCDGWIRVVPGDVTASFLHDKIAGDTSCGQPMPVGDMLTMAEVDCVKKWIDQLPPVACEMCGTDACVDLSSSGDHCGACDAPCPAGVACVEGTCVCPGEALACGGTCVDTSANAEHCGGCDAPCDTGLVCNAGSCAADCGSLTNCGGGCVDTSANASHCGGCDNPCPQGSECVASACGCPGDAPSYAADVEPIIVASCTGMGCHSAPAAQEGLDLGTGNGYDHLVGVPSGQCANRLRVDPGNPGGSYLLDKLHGTNLCFGTQMPKDGDLPAANVDLVSAWICHGALP